ncbi:hypothetical protein BV898_04485 [Hypsibius exemplaris]|uniref:Uncharacterized protein n=1 Tax=Hypsibius exemplaris TaxID=2072580 RepID=A0A1W0X286_HYPEX|nr:hypothetical protein BV898_04485 [Hypsibius exemplaris]
MVDLCLQVHGLTLRPGADGPRPMTSHGRYVTGAVVGGFVFRGCFLAPAPVPFVGNGQCERVIGSTVSGGLL